MSKRVSGKESEDVRFTLRPLHFPCYLNKRLCRSNSRFGLFEEKIYCLCRKFYPDSSL